MRKTAVYLILSLVCLSLSCRATTTKDSRHSMPDGYETQERLISSFQENIGFIHAAHKDSLLIYGDSLLLALDKAGQYDRYFELARAVVFSHALTGEMRVAIARSELMYSKAKALRHAYGTALAMNAVGEIYMQVNRLDDAEVALTNALSLLSDPNPHQYITKKLLLELIDTSLHLGKIAEAKQYLEQLNRFPIHQLSAIEQGIIYNYTAYYFLQAKKVEAAREYLDKAQLLRAKLHPGAIQHLCVTEAAYYVATGNYHKALECLESFIQGADPERNRGLYIDVMKNKAELLWLMDEKEAAFQQYAAVYFYVDTNLKTSYPKEIDQLSARFQADQLAFQNEQSRSLSIRYSVISGVACLLILLLLLLLAWKKIFRLRQSKKRQEAMKQQAENAIRKKNLFLSNMSHEVRTPLNAIVGFSTLLASDEVADMDEAARKEAGEIIRVNSQQLLKMINDILDLSDFEEDVIQLHVKEHDAVKVCGEVIETLKASHKVQVDLRLETSFSSLLIDTDDARLRQVLINLLVNALKFTREGSIVLKLEREGAEEVKFTVTDTGCGIPPEKQKLIFERFEKLDEFVQGTGLGLSICQLIIKYVGGRIWIDGDYMQGARFCFTHPLRFKSSLVCNQP